MAAQAAEPTVSSSVPLSSFDQMLTHVYLENPRLNSDRDAVKIADEKVSQANAGFRPTLAADVAGGRQREKVGDAHWLYGKDMGGTLTATQPLFSGLGTVEQKRAAESRVLAARSHLLATEQAVFFAAISDWLALCSKEKILSLNQDNVKRMRQYVDATQQRFKAGDGTKTDTAQSESRLALAETRLAVAQADSDSARDSYERDTGLAAPVALLPPIPKNLPASRTITEDMAGKNPELAQAEQEYEAAGHDIETAKSTLWPSAYLLGTVSEQNSPSLGLSRLRDDSLTLNVHIPLYQGGEEYSRVREAKAQQEKVQYDRLDVGRGVLERARLAWNNYYAAQSVITASLKASDAAGRALKGVQEEQKQGLRTLTEMLDEQSELLGAQITETEAQTNVRLEAYRLLAAIGQLTGPAMNLPDQYDPTLHHDDVVPRWAGF